MIVEIRKHNPLTRIGRRKRIKAITHAEYDWYKLRGGKAWLDKISHFGTCDVAPAIAPSRQVSGVEHHFLFMKRFEVNYCSLSFSAYAFILSYLLSSHAFELWQLPLSTRSHHLYGSCCREHELDWRREQNGWTFAA